ncbi:PQQ-binding-like beta-propeller repeat protein [Ferruginibacter lapsinanis]|uniref:PQQ-binding-like beta-propeller repeat protein n=1 Tax=Ferruginibacter lapsinanis TaxID=563172 RepID=UPI001E55172B|nr:PQQ-binding-like beta-propeller repeat protein [Ferruginibacter lapsinanis]UEG49654.1 PQQ-binding-like beta-propeller repeat protein [Ferruginibacter lapsinanis]
MKKLFFLLILQSVSAMLIAQKNADWKKDFPSKINWYKISDAGVLLVATKDALYGISPEGQDVWKADDIENIKESNLDFIENTPYIVVVKQGTTKGTNKVVDVVTGKTVISTADEGLVSVSKRLYLPRSNNLLFYGASKQGLMLMLVDLTTGKKVWEQKKIFEKNSEQIVSEAGELNDAILIATNKRIYKLNKLSGEEMYNIDMKSDLPVLAPKKKKGGMFSGFKAMGNAFSGNMEEANEMQTMTSADFFQHKDDNSFYFWNQDVLTKFDVATGKEIWKRFELPSPVAYILHDTRGMLLATAEKRQEDIDKANKGGGGLLGKIKAKNAANKNRASLYLIDPATGAEKWNSDIDLKGDVLAYKLTGNKLVLATQKDDGDNFISIADLDAGKSVTKKPLNIKGEIQDLQVTPQGLYYRTTDQINILDLESGDKTWKKGFTVKKCVGYNDNGGVGYVCANDMIYKVNFNTGDMEDWVKGLGFNKDEDPNSIQLLPEGVFVASNQNASLYDKSGKLIYHTYVVAPGRTLTGKLLSGLGGAASLAVGAAGAANSAQLSYAKGYYGSTDPQLDRDIKNSNQLASAGMSSAIASFQSIGKRFNATKQANGFIAMLTNFGNSNQAKDAGITIVDKVTGKRKADMLLGDKTSPDYTIDDLGKVVYYHSDNNTIEGFKF